MTSVISRMLLVAAALALPLGSALAAPIKTDFNGDGLADLVVGQPSKRIDGKANAGAVSIFYGRAAGLPSAPQQQLHRDLPQMGHGAQPGARFGEALATGDFNADGLDDVAIGVPFDRFHGDLFSTVEVIYGSPDGLVPGPYPASQEVSMIHVDAPEIGSGDPEMGSALAAGDWNHDGFVDLAIGLPGADVRTGRLTVGNAGAVVLLFGTRGGFRGPPHQKVLTQGMFEVPGVVGHGNRWGARLLSGDFNRDGADDLVIGAPSERVDGKAKAGAVTLLYGGLTGVFPFGSSYVVDGPGNGGIESGDEFGDQLAAGDFDGDGRRDLAIGNRFEDGRKNGEGYVTVLYGSNLGITNASRREYWHQHRSDVPGESELADHLGAAIAAADFDGDRIDDLAIGIPDENFEGLVTSTWDAGRVLVLYGSRQGLRVRNGAVSDWDRDSVGVESPRGARDRFGGALGTGDFNNDGIADLVIGVPGEDVHMTTGVVRADAGLVQILHGTRQGLSAFPELGRQTLNGGRNPSRPIRAESGDKLGERFAR